MKTVHSHIADLGRFLLVISYSLDKIHEIFDILIDFIKNSPDDYFEQSKGIPLYVTEKGQKILQENLEKFPNVYRAGTADVEGVSFLYLLGQFLTILAMRIDSIEMQMAKDEFQTKIKEPVDELFKLWGSEREMNARGLHQKFHGKTNEQASRILLPLLEKSSNITQKLSPLVTIQ